LDNIAPIYDFVLDDLDDTTTPRVWKPSGFYFNFAEMDDVSLLGREKKFDPSHVAIGLALYYKGIYIFLVFYILLLLTYWFVSPTNT
jgi:hypothetical protein